MERALSEAQEAIIKAGLSADIEYPDEMNTRGIIRVLLAENKALISALKTVTGQRDKAIADIPIKCSTCKYNVQPAGNEKCVECARQYLNVADKPSYCWEWRGIV